ncbi:Na/Pi cotransporter family protein [Pontibacterium sp.]|uniref:Na/Pi cotransporter family protein n=1 Tax=Pontibacterium sp. TaxID=2036026 RepID=UPI003565CFE6
MGVLQALGGLGVFILGMVIMVDGLHSGAGDGQQRLLARFTRSPLTGALTGAASTAVLQSSSATTIAAVGFVSAGLLSFPQALGIIYGANLGTTVTGWLVVFLGFKLKLGVLLLPLIFLGTILRVFANGRTADLGYALAGFGLIFLGISLMQQGLQGFDDLITPQTFPDDTLIGRLQLVLLGILITLITQSSSAGVAAMLTLLFAGSINFAQAAAVVIGMDLGTSVKALIATLGGHVEARRTGVSHLVFNAVTVLIALMMLDPFIYFWQLLSAADVEDTAEFALVAFHSSFNLAAVILLLPLANQFARLIEHLVPEGKDKLSLSLDPFLLNEPSIALRAVLPQIKRLRDQISCQLGLLVKGIPADRELLSRLQHLLDQVHNFLNALKLKPDKTQHWDALTAMMHCMDHLQRLHERCDEEPQRGMAVSKMRMLHTQLHALRHYLQNEGMDSEVLTSLHERLSRQRTRIRQEIIAQMVSGKLDVEEGTEQLEALRWLVRVVKHLARIDGYLAIASLNEKRLPATPLASD